MSAQQLNRRSLRRIEADVGEPILRGWSHGGYTFGFVTPDHRHGWWNKTSREWDWQVVAHPHYTSCYETWPETLNQERMQELKRKRSV